MASKEVEHKEKMGPYAAKDGMKKGGKAKAYKKGGKVKGEKGKMRLDKMPHKSYGGKVEKDIATSTGTSDRHPIAAGGINKND